MRSRRLLRRNRAAPVIDMTAMVDVVFNLLIFFMVSTTFITVNQALPVDLPQAAAAQAQAGELPTVTITSSDAIYVGSNEVTEDTLIDELSDAIEELGQSTVVLRADQSISHGLSVRVMDLITQAGGTRIAISTGD
ncbi:MAG TPA: biopolymer transporter ExbD [Deinococcales bacterium]|nr:biopolymer transporter ExbD [Deinococcales bacterium]